MNLITLTDETIPQLFELIAPESAKKRYNLGKYLNYGFMDFADNDSPYDQEFLDSLKEDLAGTSLEGLDILPPDSGSETQEFRLFKGDLTVSGIESAKDRDWNYYSLIIDGNLTVNGDIDWYEDGMGSFIFVTGNVKVHNLILTKQVEMVVMGNLEVENGIIGKYGSDGGTLTVTGTTKAHMILEEYYFDMHLSKVESKAHISYKDSQEKVAKLLLPKFFRNSEEGNIVVFESEAIEDALRNGEQILK
jgi:hypothetical protein